MLEQMTPEECFDRLCWADVVNYVLNRMAKEDISFCKGKECNYCGKYNEVQ